MVTENEPVPLVVPLPRAVPSNCTVIDAELANPEPLTMMLDPGAPVAGVSVTWAARGAAPAVAAIAAEAGVAMQMAMISVAIGRGQVMAPPGPARPTSCIQGTRHFHLMRPPEC